MFIFGLCFILYFPYTFINSVFDKVQDDFTKQQTVAPLPDTAVLNDVRKQTLLLP